MKERSLAEKPENKSPIEEQWEEWLHDEDLLVFEIKPRTFGQAEHEEADVEIEPQWPEGEPNIGFARAHRSAWDAMKIVGCSVG